MWIQASRIGLIAAFILPLVSAWPAAADSESSHHPPRRHDAHERGPHDRGERDRRAEHAERGWRMIRARLMRDIELSDPQRERVREAFEAHHEAARQWHRDNRDELRELIHQMREAHRAMQRHDDDDGDAQQRLDALREQARELMEQRPGLDELGESLAPTLDDEQWAQFEANREAVRRMIVEHMRKRGRDHRGPDPARLHERALEPVELSDAQRQRIDEVVEAHRQQRRAWMDEHREQLSDLRQQMREAREANDREAVEAAREQLRELRAESPDLNDLHTEFQEILNDEQWERFQEIQRRLREQVRQRAPGPEHRRHRDHEADRQDEDGRERDRRHHHDREHRRGEQGHGDEHQREPAGEAAGGEEDEPAQQQESEEGDNGDD